MLIMDVDTDTHSDSEGFVIPDDKMPIERED